jgi:hypothetical protein
MKFSEQREIELAERVGRECGGECRKECGTTSDASQAEPMSGDWEALAEARGVRNSVCVPRDIRDAFVREYRRALEAA